MAKGIFDPDLVARAWFSPDALAKGWFDEDLIDDPASGGATTHAASGALVAGGGTVAGSAAHIAVHGSSGALAGGGAQLAGTAARGTSAVTHAATGALVGGGALIVGSAARVTAAVSHDATGALTGGGAVISGFDAQSSGGGGGYDKPKKRKFIQKVGDKIVVFESATAAINAIKPEPVVISAQKAPPKDAVAVEAVELPKLKETAKAFGHERELMAMLNAQQYLQMLELHHELQSQQDEEDIELLALWA